MQGLYRRLLQHIDIFSAIRDKNIKFNNNVPLYDNNLKKYKKILNPPQTSMNKKTKLFSVLSYYILFYILRYYSGIWHTFVWTY